MSSDDFLGQSFRNGFERSESGGSGALGDEVDALVHSPEGRHIDGLSSNDTTGSDSSGIFSGSALGDSVNEDLNGVFAGEEVDNFESLLDDADGHLLFTVVPASHHQGVHEAFHNRHSSFFESLGCVPSSGVGKENLSFLTLDVQVVFKGRVGALHSLVGPSSEKQGFHSELLLGLFDFQINHLKQV